ncbi:uncharacterized protein LOC110098701 isoform X1 [Dendrobium catenatum]|uniref:GBF-interacting protein 1 N-terminal domain-containing protein n=1 Tax=Dendrobium catenatum TaxID=906689 RepID=A0A2I0V6S6_9ASPA|nr:uncharacterized protein LOC110098701 isoform X1 [Dendrobium catenatum]PKU59115.1 hypothetical protein MA16_Dca014857 [Dendrobium catenatum]
MDGGKGAGGSRGDGTVATAGIPAGARKMVQSLKEIVNLPEQEIYGTLKECGMDPSEAVQRLLSQDSFHEVKSKRDKKKEMKELPDSWSRTTNNTSGRGIRGMSDRVPRSSSIQSSSNGYYEGSRAKAVQKKEDGAGSVSSSSNMGSSSSVSRKSTIISENAPSENLWQGIGSSDGSYLHSQLSSGYQHTWAGMPGHFSMADIVKMGRPQGKLSATVAGNSSHFSHNHIISDTSDKYSVNLVRPSELDQRVHSHGPHQPVEDIDIDPGTTRNEHVSDDGWPSVNQPKSGTASDILETSGAAISYSDPSKVELVVDEAQLHQTSNEDEIPELDRCSNSESLPESESISDGEIQVNSSEDKSKLDEGSLQNISAYLSQRHLFEQQVDDANVEISSAAANLQNLRLQKDGLTAPSLEDNPAVIIPRHLQVTNADCSHLSFGSFGSGIGTSFSGSLQPKPLHDNSEIANVADDAPSLTHSEARNSSYYENDELKSQINEDARAGMNTVNYDMPSASEPELIRDDAVNTTHELQYNFPSLSGYGTSTSAQQSATAFSHPQTNLQMQNFASLSTLMQPYTSSLPSSLLAPTLQPLRDIDLPFSSLLATQSLSTKHSATSSISGPSISIPEQKPSVFSNLQQVPQSSSSSNLPAGHAIPQHLHINPYSQATLPLGPFPNVISYPFLPQSYTYLPSAAFPQAYTSNAPFHQSTSAVHNAGLKYTLPQYKSSLPVTSLPQPASVASAYGNYNGSANVPGNFILNPSSTSTSTALGFDEALSSQKEGAHYLHLQQNESSPMWIHNGNSRTISPLPPNTFYGFQGQNQLNNFRQAQQSAHYGPMGYLNLYQNHQLGGQAQEHQQNPGEVNLNSSQGNSSQSHQIWQHGY